MEEANLRYRMYGLVPYNLSPIQQGIQFGHALQEYNNEMFKFLTSGESFSTAEHDEFRAFEAWRMDDKTFIILNGGTTNKAKIAGISHEEYKGSLNEHMRTLYNNDVPYARFYEEDLGDQLTGVVFLVDERVYDTVKYPNQGSGGQPYLPEGKIPMYTLASYTLPETNEAYEERLGGATNVWMRKFLKQFKLA